MAHEALAYNVPGTFHLLPHKGHIARAEAEPAHAGINLYMDIEGSFEIRGILYNFLQRISIIHNKAQLIFDRRFYLVPGKKAAHNEYGQCYSPFPKMNALINGGNP